MLTMVEVRNSQGVLLSLPLEDVSDGLVLTEVEGLDPVKATLVSSSFAQMDGEQYHSSRREARNIRIHLDLEPVDGVDTVYDLRKRLYTFFMPKTEVQLRFYMSDELIVNIMGRIETFETGIFSDRPAAVISLLCYDPDFVELESILVEGETVETTDMMTISLPDGTIETGITFVLNVDRSITEFAIYHQPEGQALRTLDFAAVSMVAGDVLTISTVSGSKGATLVRSAVASSVLYGVSPQSNWIELQPGDNELRVHAEGDEIPFTIEYSHRYGGL